MNLTLKAAAAIAALLAFSGPIAAQDICTEMGSLGRSQAEARDMGVTRSQARTINASADVAEIGELSEIIADVVWGTDLEPELVEIAVDMACRQAGM